MDYSDMKPSEIRSLIRQNRLTSPTSGMASGYTQANLVILPKDVAFDFFLFCQRNPKPCPVLDVIEPGSLSPKLLSPDADIRTDIAKYRIYVKGELVEEPSDIKADWSDDLVGFLLGCSFTFEHALMQAGIPVRHVELGTNVPMYKTSIACRQAGQFQGPMVVSMRPIPNEEVVRAVQITSRFPAVHGAPVHIGSPSTIGIKDIDAPDFGDPVPIGPGETPVFWACGVTPQAVAMQSKPELMITHAPGYMFVSDVEDSAYSIL